jgi:hypothetical protein
MDGDDGFEGAAELAGDYLAMPSASSSTEKRSSRWSATSAWSPPRASAPSPSFASGASSCGTRSATPSNGSRPTRKASHATSSSTTGFLPGWELAATPSSAPHGATAHFARAHGENAAPAARLRRP